MHKEHDIVVLRRDLPALNLVEGDVGAVVGVYRAGGYEVEFSAPEGETVAVVTLGEEDRSGAGSLTRSCTFGR